MKAGPILETLLRSPEPSIRWKVRTQVLGESAHSGKIGSLEQQVRESPRVRAILRRKSNLGQSGTLRGVYYKWQGCHWALARLADLGYPEGDESLRPLVERVLDTWLKPTYFREYRATSRRVGYGRVGVPVMRGRYRRCASQQGNALCAVTRLGLDDGRVEQLAERLLHWQWPDGGWNCDRDPSADTSSFFETLLPMQGLWAHGSRARAEGAMDGARRASEVFLRRRLFKRISDGRVIRPEFVRLHYPTYYHYDVLAGLRGMVEVGRILDPRCGDALDWLEGRRLPDGGWPAESKFYRWQPHRFAAGSEFVNWGGTSSARTNPWVTADALGVLRAAGRLTL